MSISVLPPFLQQVEIPGFFPISRLADIEGCALAVFGSAGGGQLLPPEPLALFGTLLHHLRAEISTGRCGGREDCSEMVEECLPGFVEQLESQLALTPSTARLVPLRVAVGRRRWNDGIHLLRRWAASQQGGGIEEPRALGGDHEQRGERGDGGVSWNQIGVEMPLRSERLRVVGKPDLSEMHGRGGINVVDFKSGNVIDRSGEIRGSVITQLQAYALVLEEAYPTAEVQPFVDAQERVPVQWGEQDRTALLERLQHLSTMYPAGSLLEAGELASPGAMCRTCRLRHRCGAYLGIAPGWWRDGFDGEMPVDSWGTVEEVTVAEGSLSIRLREQTGRRVRIDGVSSAWGIDEIKPGRFLWFFGLESSEKEFRHGATMRPRNFHELPEESHGKRALRLAVFSDPVGG